MARAIVIDMEKCMGCNTCRLACAVAHSGAETLVEALQGEVRPQPRISVLQIGQTALALQCRHCEEAPCVEKCPKDALSKPDPDGPVVLDAQLCIGCQVCIQVCPLGDYGIVSLTPDGEKVVKCDLCLDRLEQGLAPACVEACPTNALKLMDVEQAAEKGFIATAEEMAEALAEMADT